MQAPAVEVAGLCKTYRGGWRGPSVQALRDLSLTVERGQAFGLLGPNGAGKTTLTKILLSLVRPDAGIVRLFGQAHSSPGLRAQVGYLPEAPNLAAHHTGRSFLDFMARLSGLAPDTRNRRIPDLLHQVSLHDVADRRLPHYSKGMLQRLGVAQALLHAPRLLVLDEPIDGVDPAGRMELLRLLRNLAQQGVTLLLNSHHLPDIEWLCDSIAVLHQGRIVTSGRVKDLRATQGFRIVVAALPHRLQEELAARGFVIGLDGERCWIECPNRPGLNALIDQIRAAGASIETIEPVTHSLERIYLSAVAGGGSQ
ncbi:ABC transporter ATP-binding protein [Paludibaculum fermentans]|uniref:ABC transporter ATP-binding protein n=1 Tax=Paludibaculum fermentans TaxID=1473598 RepID=A0A7S7NNF4_PALFE|nr:ABC transporter ATP-binding protein [Paludibaculum fermentans]QOY86825.1 ABC transporter ATP-binding protein [Paludibaculum fermentans]